MSHLVAVLQELAPAFEQVAYCRLVIAGSESATREIQQPARHPLVTRENIIDRRRRLQVPDEFQKEWVTVTEVGFEGDWVSPIQKISNHKTGPVLVGKHWIDEQSAKQYRPILERLGYLPGIPFNCGLDLSLECAGLTRKDIYITQACHFLPRGKERRKRVPSKLMECSVKEVTQYEVEGRRVIALGREAQAALDRARVRYEEYHPHPSSWRDPSRCEALALAAVLRRMAC